MEQLKKKFKDFVSSIHSNGLYVLVLILLVCIPFNVAYHFNSEFAYIDGFFVNYLDFVVHIVDIAAVLVLGWLLIVEGVWKERMFWIVGGALLGFFLFHNLFFRNEVVVYTSIRVLIYALCGVGLYVFMKSSEFNEGKKKDKGKHKHKKPASLFDKEILSVSFGNWIVLVLIVSALLQVAIAVYQFLSGEMIGINFLGESVVAVGGYDASSIGLPSGIFLRGYGTFPHPNVLGGYLVSVLLVTLSVTSRSKGLKQVLLIAAATLICIGILVTWSRVAWILAVVLVIMWIGKILWGKGKKVVGIYIACLIFILLAGSVWLLFSNNSLSEDIRDRFINQSSSTDISIIERMDLIDRSISMIKESPIVGVGSGMFIPNLADDPIVSESGIRVMQPVHNVFMLIFSEIGLIGVMFFIGVGVFLFRKSKFTFVAVSALAILVAVGMVDHYFWSLPQGMMILLILLVGWLLFSPSNEMV